MAEEEQSEATEAAPAKGGPGILVVLIVAIMSVGAGAGGAYFMLDRNAAPVEGEAASEGEEGEEPAEPVSYRDRLLSLEPFIVNVGGDGYARFLKLKIELEADSVATRDELEGRRPQLRDTTILLLSSKRLDDVAEFEGKSLLKDDIRDRINQLLPEGRVESVLFTEFVVQ